MQLYWQRAIQLARERDHRDIDQAAVFSIGRTTVLLAAPQRQSRRRQIVQAAKLTNALAALLEQRQPLRALGLSPVDPRSRFRRRRRATLIAAFVIRQVLLVENLPGN